MISLAQRRGVVAAAVLLGCAGASGARPSQEGPAPPLNPEADPRSIVHCDALTRFTLLMGTNEVAVVRAEMAVGGAFEDRASFAFLNRLLAVPAFTVSNSSDAVGWCNITLTATQTVVSYRKKAVVGLGSPLSQHLFQVSSVPLNASFVDGGSNGGLVEPLGGTVYSLSGVNGSRFVTGSQAPIDLTCGGARSTSDWACTNGVLSRGGVGVMSDSENNVLTPGGWWGNSAHANKKETNQDIYVFVYGQNYRPALRALAALSGKMAPPPRRFFGVWWSRWSKYSQQGLKEITDIYQDNGIPLDGINLDTEWHRSSNYLDCCSVDGKRVDQHAWYSGVFDYDQSLYPNPQAMQEWLTERGLWPVWSDIHQGSGVSRVNSKFAQFAAAVGVDPVSTASVPVAVDNRTYMTAFFAMLRAQTNTSSYWWLDNPEVGLSKLAGFNANLWDRWQFFLDAEHRGLRPTVMGPFGGLGSQRFPFIHSGDTITSWATLKFLVKYTSTAGNVLISYITHDVGGHRDYGNGGNNPELFTRWVQYCTYTAMLRPHPQRYPNAMSHDAVIERRIWVYPYSNFAAMRASMQVRSRLLPYTYTAALQALTDDVPLIRSLYVDWPAEDLAYDEATGLYHFMFGPSVLVAPILSPMTPELNLSVGHTVFLPPVSPGTAWIERGSGRCFGGGATHILNYTLDEYPVFIKPGTILPTMITPTRRWREGKLHPVSDDEPPALLGSAGDPSPKTVVWEVYLGNATVGRGVLLEDDGNGTGYTQGAIASTTATYAATQGGTVLTLTVQAVNGSFEGMRRVRHHEWAVFNVLPPTTVTGASGWTWDPETLSIRAIARDVDVTTETAITLTFATPSTGPLSALLCSADGHAFPVMARRVRAIKHAVDVEGPATLSSVNLNELDTTAQRMANAGTAAAAAVELEGFRGRAAGVVALLTNQSTPTGLPSPRLQGLIAAWLG